MTNTPKKYSRNYVYNKEGALLPLQNRTYKTNEGYNCTIIDCGNKNQFCTVQIEMWVKEVTVGQLKKGGIRYPYHQTVLGKGYLGEGIYSKKNT